MDLKTARELKEGTTLVATHTGDKFTFTYFGPSNADNVYLQLERPDGTTTFATKDDLDVLEVVSTNVEKVPEPVILDERYEVQRFEEDQDPKFYQGEIVFVTSDLDEAQDFVAGMVESDHRFLIYDTQSQDFVEGPQEGQGETEPTKEVSQHQKGKTEAKKAK